MDEIIIKALVTAFRLDPGLWRQWQHWRHVIRCHRCRRVSMHRHLSERVVERPFRPSRADVRHAVASGHDYRD